MRACRRAYAIECVCNIGHPVTQGFVHCIFQCFGARLNRNNLCTQHFHAEHIRLLPLDVHGTHIDDTFKTIFGTGSSGGDTMLPGTSFGDDTLFAHPAGE